MTFCPNVYWSKRSKPKMIASISFSIWAHLFSVSVSALDANSMGFPSWRSTASRPLARREVCLSHRRRELVRLLSSPLLFQMLAHTCYSIETVCLSLSARSKGVGLRIRCSGISPRIITFHRNDGRREYPEEPASLVWPRFCLCLAGHLWC